MIPGVLDNIFSVIFEKTNRSMVVIDQSGEVVLVNAAWRRFAAENGAAETQWVGRNYLGVCRSAVSADPEAERCLRGLEHVLGGESDYFRHEYPCHSPARRRWFVMEAIRISYGALIMHSDITRQQIAEEFMGQRVRESLKAQLPFFDSLKTPIFILNLSKLLRVVEQANCGSERELRKRMLADEVLFAEMQSAVLGVTSINICFGLYIFSWIIFQLYKQMIQHTGWYQ